MREDVGFRASGRRDDFDEGECVARGEGVAVRGDDGSGHFQAQEQARRYEGLISQCRVVQGPTDLNHLVRSVTVPPNHPPVRRHFTAPQPPQPQEGPDGQPLPLDPAIAAVSTPDRKRIGRRVNPHRPVAERAAGPEERDRRRQARQHPDQGAARRDEEGML